MSTGKKGAGEKNILLGVEEKSLHTKTHPGIFSRSAAKAVNRKKRPAFTPETSVKRGRKGAHRTHEGIQKIGRSRPTAFAGHEGYARKKKKKGLKQEFVGARRDAYPGKKGKEFQLGTMARR